MNWVLVLGAAAVGAPLRYLVDRFVQRRHGSLFPWGTLAVNTVACLILGFLTTAVTADSRLLLLVGTGFCGALSTYSTFTFESVQLARNRARGYAIANVVGSMVAGLAAIFLGSALAQAIWA
ncbi:fluoride efflux transporter CrcB [Nocardia brasiliensis]|uniref:Fluoride-specific ion channel FluC n=1 Tax=Nocardia brasiliensis TaxID=37326 RepID=A0A6G9XPS2_NOCBR|nr:fluoride efflux transporter CrcB [Nocardia brasiliensis]QIS02941.1 fluoride efflux transporter CrcB [Nocardia brasiliensis]